MSLKLFILYFYFLPNQSSYKTKNEIHYKKNHGDNFVYCGTYYYQKNPSLLNQTCHETHGKWKKSIFV